MTKIHIAICDDDKNDQKKYTKWIEEGMKQFDLDVHVVCYDSGRALLFQMEDASVHPDILFMDIHMPGEDGMEISKMLRDESKEFPYKGELIFLTKSSQYAIDAFDVDACHYVVKNVTTQTKFNEILHKACEKQKDKKRKQLLLRGNGEYRNIDVESIHYFEIYRRIITVHYGTPEQEFEFYSSMSKLEEIVRPFGFLRTYKSVLVNGNEISSFSKAEARLKCGARIPVSDTYYKNLKCALQNI